VGDIVTVGCHGCQHGGSLHGMSISCRAFYSVVLWWERLHVLDGLISLGGARREAQRVAILCHSSTSSAEPLTGWASARLLRRADYCSSSLSLAFLGTCLYCMMHKGMLSWVRC